MAIIYRLLPLKKSLDGAVSTWHIVAEHYQKQSSQDMSPSILVLSQCARLADDLASACSAGRWQLESGPRVVNSSDGSWSLDHV